MRDRTRTLCPYTASTKPPKAGEEAHENGIGMPPPPAAGAKVREGLERVFEELIDRSVVFLFFSDALSTPGVAPSSVEDCQAKYLGNSCAEPVVIFYRNMPPCFDGLEPYKQKE